MATKALWGGWRSFFRHARLAQADEINSFEQGANLRTSKGSHGPQTGDARITIIAAQSAGFGKFGSGAPALSFEGIGGGEVGVRKRLVGIGSVCPLEPEDSLINARLQQMRLPDPEITEPDLRIAWTETDGPLLCWDCLVE